MIIIRLYYNTPKSLTPGRTRFWSVVIYFRSRIFLFLCRLVRPSQNGERAGPLAKMLLGAKHGGRPRIVSRIIVEEYFALWVFPTCSTAMFCHLGQFTERWLGAIGKKTRATQSIGAERVSVCATDQCSYGKPTTDRKSTIGKAV